MNHRTVSIMLDTGATVSVLSEQMWRKCGGNSSLTPVTATLTAANGNQIEVEGETEIRIRIAAFDTSWTVIVARGLSHDCLLGTNFFHEYKCKICYDTRTFMVGATEVPIHYQKVKPVVCRVILLRLNQGLSELLGEGWRSGLKETLGAQGLMRV